MAKTNMEKVIERYNGIMNACGYEYCTIGTNFSEDTENWNLRDMVAECDYWLGTFYEDGHCNHDLISDCPNEWKSLTGKLKRFIARFKDEALQMEAWTGHCSEYDSDSEHRLCDEWEKSIEGIEGKLNDLHANIEECNKSIEEVRQNSDKYFVASCTALIESDKADYQREVKRLEAKLAEMKAEAQVEEVEEVEEAEEAAVAKTVKTLGKTIKFNVRFDERAHAFKTLKAAVIAETPSVGDDFTGYDEYITEIEPIAPDCENNNEVFQYDFYSVGTLDERSFNEDSKTLCRIEREDYEYLYVVAVQKDESIE